jgi:hypothetical protein
MELEPLDQEASDFSSEKILEELVEDDEFVFNSSESDHEEEEDDSSQMKLAVSSH